MTAALLDHLWQSTLFAAGIALLMPLFRHQAAALRFWLWFAASMKFLVPFSAIVWLGRHVLAPDMPAQLLSAVRPVAPSLQKIAPLVAPAPVTIPLLDMALLVWGAGIALLALLSLSRWLELRAAVREAEDISSPLPVPMKSAPSFLEPGLVGIWRPAIFLPKGLAQQLSQAELDAVLAHELCHLKRRDNLLAALHMLVERLFWFHPLVWWLGARLIEERERSCDEAVLGAGTRPRDYAQGILKTCRFYVQSPLACASGVSGALELRLEAILAPRPAVDLSAAKGLLLAMLGASVLLLPLITGMAGPQQVARLAARLQTALAAPLPSFTIPRPAPRPAVAQPQRLRQAPQAAAEPSVPQPEPHRLALPTLGINLIVDATPPAIPANEPSVTETNRVCRPPQRLPGSRLKGPQVCLRADEWAELKAQHLDISADGRSRVAIDYEQQRAITGHSCQSMTPYTLSNAGGAGMPNCF
jgi:beta-lactamase regulating signal transducer with metallopeptidase domain